MKILILLSAIVLLTTSACPLRKCLPCDNGYVYDKDNCQTCDCYDPCKNVQCPYGQECQAKQVTCVRAPCYPVGECVALPKYVCPVYDAKASCGDKRNPFDCNPRSSACPAGSLCCGYECSGTRCETNLCEAPDRYTNCFKQETRECESAAQCGADQICCNIICGGTRCKPKTNTGSSLVSQEKQPVCPEVLCTVACQYGNIVDENGCQTCNCNPADPCSTVRCSAGYHCQTTQVQCVRAPCPPITGCVADAPSCPQVRCAQYCEHGYVYDSNNCQTCQCYDACKNNPCSTGQKCVSHEVTCVKAPCYPVGECVPATTCPDLGNCGIRCAWGHAYDANGCELCQCYDPCQNVKCTGTQVCQGQNLQCVTTPCLAQGVCVDSDKKGAPQMVCPKIEKSCPSGQKRLTCADDSGCGNKKCCSTGCGYNICLPPERAGSCPEYNPALILCAVPKPGDEENQCGTDVVCPGVQKCCDSPCTGMGKRCVDPE